MTQLIVSIIIYLAGFFISYWMQRVEVAAEKQIYTKGDRLLNITFSLLSWLWVLIALIVTWIKQISKTGYWNQPVKESEPVKEQTA